MDELTIQDYISKMEGADAYSSKASLFSNLVENLFGEEVDVGPAGNLFPELEGHLIDERGTLAIEGEDDPQDNIIIEFRKTNLDPLRSKEIIERAENQLRRYVYVVWRERKPELRCLLMASDGLHNFVYRPSLKEGLEAIDLEGGSPFAIDKKLRKIIELEKISYEDFSRGDPDRVCTWLKRLISGRLSDG
ncbi:hypothetical protein AKJ51_00225 [candidate division MSBL1 archaeon SCGC-AAA382A20]|uniref:Uncharacterized protein n=1 Tax=candidate division MSBL1 archaeon SCGC-AAA382A20 TaxID=1698280 RepID=A0A133VMW2_9EURY|nr:hypothetical protein AKJ51_00225 [candidate division MSBL1 archaeon SCGC-AAA382A20]